MLETLTFFKALAGEASEEFGSLRSGLPVLRFVAFCSGCTHERFSSFGPVPLASWPSVVSFNTT